MSRRMKQFFLVAVLALSGWALPAAAQSEISDEDVTAARDFVTGVTDKALGILRDPRLTEQERETRLAKAMNDHFAMDYIGRFVLGRHRRQATPQEFEDYQAVFDDYIVKTYLTRLDEYSNEKVEIGRARPSGRDVLVQSRILPVNGDPIPMEWRARKMSGDWRIIDVKVEGISQAITQRDEFSSLIQRKGMQGLIDELHRKTGSSPTWTEEAGPSAGGRSSD